ncbi:hypothetical protein D3C78_1990950 [compost metagenome]
MLLKVALMCAWPWASITTMRFLVTFFVDLAILIVKLKSIPLVILSKGGDQLLKSLQ